jgi:nucleotide-binding universal stress UspA family protein
MLAIRTILHPTDFSEQSQAAFVLACALTRDYGARLIALHVVATEAFVYGEGYLPPTSEELLADAREQFERLQPPQGTVRAEHRLEQGDAAPEILRVAQEVHADLIVMGTHGRTGLSRLLMGSVAEQIVRKAACPVLTMTAPFVSALSPVTPGEEPTSATAAK